MSLDSRKISLVGTFVLKNSISKVVDLLERDFRVSKRDIFIHNIKEEEDKYFLTYKVRLNYDERNSFRKKIRGTFPIHKKGICYFTINGLNRLIEETFDLPSGNVKHKDYQIKWEEYLGKLIMSKGEDIYIVTVDRVFL
tara:strand:- start:12118 stop:12534 length:417 start_codon:yes stop_codon:yes gene_type:complete